MQLLSRPHHLLVCRQNGLGFRTWDQDSGIRDRGSGFRVQGLGIRSQGFRALSFLFEVQGSGLGSGLRAQALTGKIWGLSFTV